MSAARGLPIYELARLCAAETTKFSQQLASDTQFCFELFRRALAEGASEEFTQVYRTYERQVLAWVHRHPQFVFCDEPADYFASTAWARFYQARRGARFADFESLPQVLSYLKICVFSAVTLYLRERRRPNETPLEAARELGTAAELAEELLTQQIVAQIDALLPDPRDRALARAAFVEGLKPREIVQAYLGWWKDERAVSVDLYRIRKLLRADSGLRDLLSGA